MCSGWLLAWRDAVPELVCVIDLLWVGHHTRLLASSRRNVCVCLCARLCVPIIAQRGNLSEQYNDAVCVVARTVTPRHCEPSISIKAIGQRHTYLSSSTQYQCVESAISPRGFDGCAALAFWNSFV